MWRFHKDRYLCHRCSQSEHKVIGDPVYEQAVIKKHLISLGYRKEDIAQDYEFADVFDRESVTRKVNLVAFADTPFSYKTASIGVVSVIASPEIVLPDFSSLGAPIWLCFTQNEVEVWSVQAKTPPVKLEAIPSGELGDLFDRYKKQWSPQAVYRAKLLSRYDPAYQLDFVDLGLLPAIESEVRTKLDRSIRNMLKDLLLRKKRPSPSEIRNSYRLCFLMLAAKVLSDRQHPHARDWPSLSTDNVVEAISSFYGLDLDTNALISSRPQTVLDSAWSNLNLGMSYQHVSVDDLAFVYENTLVSPETRERYGTHSTPRSVADFLAGRLNLHKFKHSEDLVIIEPFCGSAVLAVSAMKTIRSVLPRKLSDRQRHDFLVKRVVAADVDAFACEVAQLSLILSDYPNRNGWDVKLIDLFEGYNLDHFIKPNSCIVCNPPFQDFSLKERDQHSEIANISVHKPLAVLASVLNANPIALGFVLPQAILTDNRYKDIRRQLAKGFKEIDLVALPDRIFVHSSVESALLVARYPKSQSSKSKTKITCMTVDDHERKDFLNYGVIGNTRSKLFPINELETGDLWLSEFYEIWDYLSEYPRLGDYANLHRGLEWVSGHQRNAVSQSPKSGYQPGLHSLKEGFYQFVGSNAQYLDCRKDFSRGGAIDLQWHAPKILLNAARLSRGPW